MPLPDWPSRPGANAVSEAKALACGERPAHPGRDDVCMIVVTFNSRHCIDRIAPVLADFRHVIVVDNASEDDTRECVSAALPHAELIASPVNLGFGAANNLALNRTLAPYAFLMNPDCLPTSECIDTLLEAASRFPEAAILAPQLQRDAHTLEISYRWPSRVWRSRGPGADGPCCVGFVSGAAMMLNRQVMQAVGFFDEDFFLYYEDEDLCLRTFEAGRAIILVPSARLTHLSRGSSRGGAPLRIEYLRGFHHAQSKILFTSKHEGTQKARALRSKTLALAWLTLIPRLLLPSPRYLSRLLGRIVGLHRAHP